MSCGIGNVLSSPRAANPRSPMNTSERTKMRNKMAWHSLDRVIGYVEAVYLFSHIKPTRNSRY